MSSRKMGGVGKDFIMEMFSKEGSKKVFQKVEGLIFGQMEQNLMDSLVVDCVQAKEFFQPLMDLSTKDSSLNKNLKDCVSYQCLMETHIKATFAKAKRMAEEY